MDAMQIEQNDGGKGNGEEFCRQVEAKFTPYLGQEFVEMEEAITFYKIYAVACGFDVRKYTTKRWHGGEIKSKLLVCNREGSNPKAKHEEGEGEQKLSRITKVRRVGCQARIRLFVQNGLLLIDRFHEGHNHELISVRDREFQKLSRNITDYHKMIILSNSRLKIGATRTYKMCKEHVDGFENIGASLNDFKNFHRDVKCFIHEQDGQLFIDHFKQMAETREGFYFDYETDEDGSLVRAIWADGIARKNYSLFGDGLSFDPTYSTNMYSIVFTPFTGVDHHGRSVTFCGALLAKEDYESFNWVFSRFLIAMGGKEPEYIITDQDPGIIKSVPLVFKTARHRFCMWHLMNKVPTKFGVTRPDYGEFINRLNGMVWDEDFEAEEFDAQWAELVEKHELGDNAWFAHIYSIRKQWVMAHCRDLRMSSIMRTTQRSESENSFFKIFEHKTGTLVEFWTRFVSAMDQQRHTQKKLDNDDKHSSPKISTQLHMEAHVARVYTYSAFRTFQEEAECSRDTCKTGGFEERGDSEVTIVKDAEKGRSYEVIFSPGTLKASCSCRLFERSGILRRHMLWIYSSNGVKSVPDEYLAKRWKKDALRFGMFNSDGEATDDIDVIDGKQIAMSTMWSKIHQVAGNLRGRSKTDVESFTALIRGFKEELAQSGEPLNKKQKLEKILGFTASADVQILPPKNSRNKGSGKRLLSSKSKAVALAGKPKRMCKNCKQMANHDKRNCPNPFAEHPPSCSQLSETESHNDLDEDSEGSEF